MSGYETLRRQSDFDRVFGEGKWRSASAFVLGVLERGDEAPSRVGFVTGRRIGSPVRRNRARRRLREAVRRVAEGLKPGADIVVLARSRAREIEFTALAESMSKALTEVGRLGEAARSKDSGP